MRPCLDAKAGPVVMGSSLCCLSSLRPVSPQPCHDSSGGLRSGSELLMDLEEPEEQLPLRGQGHATSPSLRECGWSARRPCLLFPPSSHIGTSWLLPKITREKRNIYTQA